MFPILSIIGVKPQQMLVSPGEGKILVSFGGKRFITERLKIAAKEELDFFLRANLNCSD